MIEDDVTGEIVILVGASRFERPTTCTPSKCANQAALRPDVTSAYRYFGGSDYRRFMPMISKIGVKSREIIQVVDMIEGAACCAPTRNIIMG